MYGKKLLKAFLILSVVLLLLGSATAVTATPEEGLPWRVSYTGNWVPSATHTCIDGAVPLYTVGYGTATRLGAMKMETWDCVNLVSGAITDGTVTFTAANGDELYGTFFGQVVGVPDEEGWIPFIIESSYSGGTGRFSNATGEATEYGSVKFETATTGLIRGELTGSVLYDASDISG